jgi:hypothetical protein
MQMGMSMLLKIRRSQKSSMMGNAIFGLAFRAEVSDEERDLINKYKLGKDVIYSSENYRKNVDAAISPGGNDGLAIAKGIAASLTARFFNLKITVNDLIYGKHIEMKNLNEMLSAEDQVVQACNNLKSYITAAKSFDGREVVVEV